MNDVAALRMVRPLPGWLVLAFWAVMVALPLYILVISCFKTTAEIYGDKFGLVPAGLTLDKVKAAPSGIDLGQLEPRVPEILRTPSGKIELAPAMLIDDPSTPA